MTESKIRVRSMLRSLKDKTRLATGFSMLEAVVVVGVLLALAVGGFFAYGPITQNAKFAKVKSTASDIYTAAMVAQIDGDSSTKPQDVIDTYNASNDKIRVELLDPAGGNALLGAMTTAGYIPQTDRDICVSAFNVAESSIKASFGNCPVPVVAPPSTPAPTVSPTTPATSTPTPAPTVTPAPIEESWQVRDPKMTASILSIAMTDAGKVYIVGNGTNITSSSDAGVSWSQNSTEGGTPRQQIVTSKNGEIVLTGSTVTSAQMRISRNGGITYESPGAFVNGSTGQPMSSIPKGFNTFGMSDDGKVMVAMSPTSSIWLSNDYGITWADQSSKYLVGELSRVSGGTSVSISDDGSKILVNSASTHIYSNDVGKTWTRVSGAVSVNTGKYASDMSSDGNVIVVAAGASSKEKGIVKSVNGGKTWTSLTNPDPSYTQSWYAVVCSSDCSRIAASNQGSIYFSSDSGLTWRKQEKIAPQIQWVTPIALSSDGSTLAIGDTAGKFFIGTPKP